MQSVWIWIFIANANASHLRWKWCAILAHGALWGLLQGEEHRDKQGGGGGEEEEQLQPEPEGGMPLPRGGCLSLLACKDGSIWSINRDVSGGPSPQTPVTDSSPASVTASKPQTLSVSWEQRVSLLLGTTPR